MNKIKGIFKTNTIYLDDKFLSSDKSLNVIRHSPTGFAWGYGGSGPAQLALALLLPFTDKRTASFWHQEFKWDVVSKWPRDDFEVEVDIPAWIESKRGSVL